MTIYATVDAATDELLIAFHSLIPVVAEQANVPEPDALYHLRRSLMDRLKALKLSDRVDYRDDGRAALWRARLMVWDVTKGEENASLLADSSPDEAFTQSHIGPGVDVMPGLPAVARWALDLITQCHAQMHPDCVVEGLSEGVLVAKLRSIRVALSNGGGEAVWRLRYAVKPAEGERAPHTPGSLRGVSRIATLRHFRADVRIAKEDGARRNTAVAQGLY